MPRRTVWLENLVLMNKCIQESGGVMQILDSYTDPEGDVAVRIDSNVELLPMQQMIYQRSRIVKGNKD
jgi:hypothetical protein